MYSGKRSKQVSSTIHGLIEKKARINPEDIAIIENGRSINYQELNERANTLAHFLRARHIEVYGKELEKDRLVGLFLERSIEAVIGILGILKAGAAYIPLDSTSPPKRLRYMLENSQAALIVTQSTFQLHLSDFKERLVLIDDKYHINYSKENPIPVSKSPDLAYVIYTSGTTGSPKGVMIEHASVVNYSKWFSEYTDCKLGQCFDLSANLIFDRAITTSITPLVLGMKIVICSEDIKLNARKYLSYLRENKINIISITPSYFKILLLEVRSRHIDLPDLKIIILGGESLHSIDCSQWLEIYPIHTLFNEYGPTETTVAVTQYKITNKNRESIDIIPIGKPGNNISCYVYGPSFSSVATGETGELYIGGSSLARGYLNLPTLTKERFLDKSFSQHIPERLYKTGDLVKVTSDMDLLYLGRVDRQVKIRGYRIELDEIEKIAETHPDIFHSAVVVNNIGDSQQLTLFYTSRTKSKKIKGEAARNFLRHYLPNYMVPIFCVQIDKMPLISNGKIDYQKLKMTADLQKNRFNKSKDNYQGIISIIWKEILGISVNADSHFFESGGHSLTAMRVIQRIYEQFNIDLKVTDLYGRPRLYDFSQFVKNSHTASQNKTIFPELKRILHTKHAPLTSAQKRLWYVDQYEKTGAAYNVPLVFNIKGKLNVKKLTKAFNTLIYRHAALRTRFIANKHTEPRQFFDINIAFELKQERCTPENLLARIDNIIHTPFDLKEGSLLRGYLIGNKEDFVLIILMHHIICDEITINLFLKELSKLYSDSGQSSALSHDISIADYAIWEKKFISYKINDNKKYWNQVISSQQLENPFWQDTHQGDIQLTGNTHHIQIDHLLYEMIKSCSKVSNVSLHSTLLSLLSAFISRYFNKENVVLLIPVSSRENKHSESMFGFFLNLLPIFQKIYPGLTFSEHVININRQIADVLSHRFIPFEELKTLLLYGGSLPVDAFVSFQDKTNEVLLLGEVSVSRRNVYLQHIKFPLSFHFYVFDDYAEVHVEHSDSIKLFDFNAVLNSFIYFINQAVKHCKASYSDFSVLLPGQQEKIIAAGTALSISLINQSIAGCLLNSFQKHKNKAALFLNGIEYNYDELYRNCAKITFWIKEKSITGPIIILMDGSKQSVFCYLGIILAEHVYAPLSNDTPICRLQTIIHELNPALIISDKENIIPPGLANSK